VQSQRGTLTSDNSRVFVRRRWIGPKNFVLGCDGTDNEVIGNPTNVLRVFRMRTVCSFRELGERLFLRGLTGESARRTIKVVNLGRGMPPCRRSLRWMPSKRLI
jgi:hypothetical protein